MAHNTATRQHWYTVHNTEVECNSLNIITSMLYYDYVLHTASSSTNTMLHDKTIRRLQTF